jgi:AraC-like DNA-binding protein
VEQQLIYEGSVRIWDHRPGRWVMSRPHHHIDLEMNLCLAGRAAYLVDGRRIALEPGSLLFLHPGESHLLIDETRDFRMWIAVWRPVAVQAAVAEGLDGAVASERPAAIELRRLAPAAVTALSRLCAEVAETRGPALVHGGAFLLWRLRTAFAAGADQALAAAHPAVVLAARLLRDDPSLPLGTVAHRAGLSADRLGRVFRAEAGLSLVDYRTRVRLERVCSAWHPDADLLRLSLDAGFGSYSAFHRAFLRRFGLPPRAGLTQGPVAP